MFYKNSFVKDCLVSEMELNGKGVIGIEILPYAPEAAGMTEEEIRTKLQTIVDEVNSNLPPYKRVLKLVVRAEDFKKTGALKIDRNQN